MTLKPQVVAAAILIPVVVLCLGAGWDEQEDATGDWGGMRSRLEENYGLHFDLDYTNEIFGHDSGDDLSYRGNIDLVLTIDTHKFGLWRNGTIVIYGQHTHGDGVSDDLNLIMPVTNLEAESFTQLSEFWLYQGIGQRNFRARRVVTERA